MLCRSMRFLDAREHPSTNVHPAGHGPLAARSAAFRYGSGPGTRQSLPDSNVATEVAGRPVRVATSVVTPASSPAAIAV